MTGGKAIYKRRAVFAAVPPPPEVVADALRASGLVVEETEARVFVWHGCDSQRSLGGFFCGPATSLGADGGPDTGPRDSRRDGDFR